MRNVTAGHVLLAPFLLLTAVAGVLEGLTIEVSSGAPRYVSVGDDWRYFRGREAPSSPADAWKEPAFSDAAWELGPSGFGYGDGDDATPLADMAGNYVSVFTRKEFVVTAVPAKGELVLEIDYDDGFVAHLGGREVARRNVRAGAVAFDTHGRGLPRGGHSREDPAGEPGGSSEPGA